ncbi:TetR/AcrR family transcriptional regulator [Modestobacter roseus]|uniref:TetR/AcrR family transcriptional regulator n=2 Tax=Modestobacter roseus TaxID=1181884 RepID=UPI001412D8CE|nr:TetR/AcrR family transcriptional regulator [Modestobacter roseus]
MQEPAGLREAKKAATRRALRAAATTLALEHGLDGVTVDQVCAAAGVSLRTFFNYFESKEAALLGEEPPLGSPQGRKAFAAGGPSGDLLADLLTLLDPSDLVEQEGRTGLLQAMQLAQQEPRLLAGHIAREIAHEQEVAALVATRRGLPEPDLGCAALATTAQALLRLAGRSWIDAEDDSSLREHIDATRAAYVAALGSALP